MKSWFYTKHGSPSVMEMGTQPDPKLVDPKDVVVKVHAAALNPIDYKRRQGAMKLIIKDTWPQIVGPDSSKTSIVACGIKDSMELICDLNFQLFKLRLESA
ncbi:alcohol dehydrogenase [Plasmopara halstedii]|uniref:Alcohol dehydrogenase n=1 Tax=Plasmopara halstedii TaxID=4781 RepID=A0A0P1ASV0_PLAHL|nr:alcohol dehydrogenase [Plasmopara halstedii]CEG45226.1 alcohol dehydrogenase [Plasmopara halstedii]|eukprot:XP_024581595.1 alcohol dehydrogenase [Plasmopara halstedii]